MSDFSAHKATILRLTKGSTINLMVAKQKAGLTMIRTVADAEAVLKVLTKPRKITPPVPQYVKDRYNEAHRVWVQREAPNYYKEGYTSPVMPKIHTGNGLNTFIENFITWMGYRATRINVTGRRINGKWARSSTRTGTADVDSTIKSLAVKWETKAPGDRPSPAQLKEQAREIKAGGQYHFIYSAEQFLGIFDSIVYG